jgi:magnesium transporter
MKMSRYLVAFTTFYAIPRELIFHQTGASLMLEEVIKPEIQERIAGRDLWGLHRILSDWEPCEIASLMDDLPASDDVIVFRLLPRELAAVSFEHLSHDKQEALIEALANKKDQLADLLNDLAPDDRTALLEELPGPVDRQRLNG